MFQSYEKCWPVTAFEKHHYIPTWPTWMDVRIEETSYVGLHRFWSMSKHILPSAYTNIRQSIISFQHVQEFQQRIWITIIISRSSPFGWNILEIKRTVGGLLGYSSENSITSLKVPAERKMFTRSGILKHLSATTLDTKQHGPFNSHVKILY